MNLNQIDLNKVAVFSQVVESGGYRLASEALNITPSAISQTISILEHSTGFALFHRVGKRLIPTENGLALHREFSRFQGGFSQALQKLADDKDQVTGVLRIGAYLEFAKSQLAPIIAAFLKRHESAQIKISFETPSRLQRLLEDGRIDLCFSIFPSVQTRLIESRSVYKEELVLVAPRGIITEKPTFNEIMATPMIEYYFNHQPIRRWIELHFKRRPLHLPIRSYAATAEMVLALVREGAGIGVVPKYILDGHATTGSLKVIRPTERKFADHIWMLERKMSAKRPIHGAFCDEIDKALSHART